MYVLFFLFAWCIYTILTWGHLTESCIYMLLLKAPEYAQSHITFLLVNCLSILMQAFGCSHRKGIILLQLQWKGLGLFLVSLEFPYFHFSISVVNRVEYQKTVAKMSNLQTEKQTLGVSVSSCVMTPDIVKVCQVLQAGIIL